MPYYVLSLCCSKTNGRFVLVSDEPSFCSKKLEALGWKIMPLEKTLRDSVVLQEGRCPALTKQCLIILLSNLSCTHPWMGNASQRR